MRGTRCVVFFSYSKKSPTCFSFRQVGWNWISRRLKRAAHEAALIGVRAVELESWVSRPPLSQVQVLVSDWLPCPPICLLFCWRFVFAG